MSAADGRAALAVALEWAPDIVLLQNGLRDMSSLDLAQRLRSLPQTAASVIVCAGDRRDDLQSFAAGVDLHVAAVVQDIDHLRRLVDAARARVRLAHPHLASLHDPAPSSSQSEDPIEATAAAMDGSDPGSGTILVVDDERAIRRLVEGVLHRAGYAVTSMDSAGAALDWWREHQGEVILVITDVVMPGGSGPQMLDAMRRDRPELPAIVMSGYAAEGLTATGPLPSDGFLHKPFTPDELRAAVADRLAAAI